MSTNDDDTRPESPRAKLSTHNRMQVRVLVETWLAMAPKRRRARIEYEDGVHWAIISDERGYTARVPLGSSDDLFHAWARAMGDLPPRETG